MLLMQFVCLWYTTAAVALRLQHLKGIAWQCALMGCHTLILIISVAMALIMKQEWNVLRNT